MGPELSKWLAYAKARIRDAVRSGDAKLDELEARREAERADRPWLSEDGEELTFEQVRARIEWEERRAAERSGGPADGSPSPGPGRVEGTSAEVGGSAEPRGDGAEDAAERPGPGGRSPEEVAADAELEMARLQLEERERASRDRLEAIRRELGVEPPSDDEGSGPTG